jgi:hypothetical protein
MDARQRWKRGFIVERFAPLAERLNQCRQLDLSKAPRWLGKIPYGAFQYRSHAHSVSRGMVVKGYGNLNQSLKKLFVFGRCSAPNILEGFMSVEEFGVVEEANSAEVRIGIHSSFWHRTVRKT